MVAIFTGYRPRKMPFQESQREIQIPIDIPSFLCYNKNTGVTLRLYP